jgi:hypothetical protein
MTDGARTPRPSAKQIRDSFERPTMWQTPKPEDPATTFLLALQPERKAA